MEAFNAQFKAADKQSHESILNMKGNLIDQKFSAGVGSTKTLLPAVEVDTSLLPPLRNVIEC